MPKENRWAFRCIRVIFLIVGLLLALAATSVLAGDLPRPAAPAETCLPEALGQIPNVPDPKGIAANETGGKFYVASYSTNSLLVVDAASKRVVQTVAGIPSPNQVAYNPTLNRIFITNRDANSLTVLDGDDYHALFAPIPVGQTPYGVGVDSGDGRVYVANFASYTVSVVDGVTGEVVATPPAPRRPTFVAVDAKRHVAYVASLDTGNISVVTAQGEVSSFAHLEDAGTVGIALDPGLDRLFVTSWTGTVYVYDVPTRARLAAIPVGRRLWTAAMNPADHRLFAAVNGSPGWVEQIDGQTPAYAGHAAVGAGDGEGLAVNSVSGQMLVSNFNDDSLTLLQDTCATAPPDTEERWYGQVKVTAQKFEPVAGKPGFFRATGGIRLGDHFTLADLPGEQAWVEFSETTMQAWGQLGAFDGSSTLSLLRGGFSVLTDGVSHPTQTAITLLNQIAGFPVVGGGRLPEFNLTPDGFRIQGSGAIDLAGSKATAGFTISLAAGKFHVEGSVHFTDQLKLGDGAVLSISDLMGSLGTGGAQVAGVLHIRLPEGNEAEAPVTLLIKRDGTFSATAKVMGSWQFHLAGSTLTITNFMLDQTGVAVDSAVLNLPSSLGSGVLAVQALKITPAGLTHGGIMAQTTQPLRLGVDGFEVTVDQIRLEIPPNWGPFRLEIDGQVKIVGDGFATQASATLTLQGLQLSAAIHDFNLNISGLTVGASDVRLEGSRLSAKLVTLGMPQGFGGATVTVYGLEVWPGGIQIAGGTFALPDIDAGGFRLTNLSGGFVPIDHGYKISASGAFVTGDLAATTGCQGISVAVAMRITSSGEVVVEVDPADSGTKTVRSALSAPNSSEGFWLDHAALSFACRIPIGTTGFYLASVGGEFSLDQAADNITVQITIKVESERVPGLSAAPLAADGSATLNTKPFSLLLEATVAVFGAEMSKTSVLITPNRFSATIDVQLAVLHGQVAVNAWSSDGRFHFTGTGTAEISMTRGSIFTWRAPLIGPIVLPPSDVNIGGVDVAAGEFSNGKWGFRGRACFQGYCAGVYVDTTGRLTVGNVDQYVLVTPTQFAAARAAWLAQGQTAGLQADAEGPEIWVLDANVISTPVTVTAGADVIFLVNRSAALPSLTLVTPPPALTPITPGALPATIQYALDAVPGATPADPLRRQEMYVVHAAQGGVWQAVLTGNPGPGETYAFAAVGAAPPPVLGGVVALDTGALSASLTWRLTAQAPVTVSVYAQAAAALGVQDVETGVETAPLQVVYTNPAPRTDGQPQTAALDLGGLASGVYHLWAEADDGRSAPARAPAGQTVDVAQTWSATWTAHLQAAPGYRSLTAAWDRSPQPDVDRYVLHVRRPPAMFDTPMKAGQSLALPVGGLEPGQTYQLWVEAVDDDVRPPASSHSEEIAVVLPTFAFDLLAADASLTLIAGDTAAAPLTLRAAQPDYPDRAVLSPGDAATAMGASRMGQGLPAGFSLGFTPAVITPTLAGATAQVEISVDAHQPGGQYVLPIEARAGGVTRTLSLHVTVIPPSFTLLAAPSSLTLSSGGAAAIVIETVGVFGAQDPVSLSVQNAPPGLRAGFEQDVLLPGQRTTLLAADTPALPAGTYSFEVVGIMGLVTRTQTVNVRVLDRTDIFFPRAVRTAATVRCPQLAANGGFEQDAAWTFLASASTGGYSSEQAHGGSRSARLGLAAGADAAVRAEAGAERNLLGERAPTAGTFSALYQTISIPPGAARARLSFWYLPFSQDRTHDLQRVLLLEAGSYRVLAVVQQTAEDGGQWRQVGFDLGAFAGQEALLYFEVFNDSAAAGGRTWMYVDDVSVLACQ